MSLLFTQGVVMLTDRSDRLDMRGIDGALLTQLDETDATRLRDTLNRWLATRKESGR